MYNNNFGKSTEAEAKRELVSLQAAKLFATNNDFGCEIHIAGVKIGVSENTRILPIIEQEMEEISKFLKGQPNTWE